MAASTHGARQAGGDGPSLRASVSSPRTYLRKRIHAEAPASTHNSSRERGAHVSKIAMPSATLRLERISAHRPRPTAFAGSGSPRHGATATPRSATDCAAPTARGGG